MLRFVLPFACACLLSGVAAGTPSDDFSVVINEIAYHPLPASGMVPARLQWIELYNRGAAPVHLGGWRFSEGISFRFPEGVVLPGGGFLVVCKDAGAFGTVWPEVPCIGDFGGALDNDWDRITLVNRQGFVVDSVFWGDHSPYPSKPDGLGATLELIDPWEDNDRPEAWAASIVAGGTPGQRNSRAREETQLVPFGALWRLWRGEEEPAGEQGAWVDPAYDDSAWEQAEAPFGFGESGLSTVLNDMEGRFTTVFARISFEVKDPEAFEELILTVDFDDGFIAFLNGRKQASAFMPGSGVPDHGFRASEAHESGYPLRWPLDPGVLRRGKNVLAVLGANESRDSRDFVLSVTLSGRLRSPYAPVPRLIMNEVGTDGTGIWVEVYNEAGTPVSAEDLLFGTDLSALRPGIGPDTIPPKGFGVFALPTEPLSGTCVLVRGSDGALIAGIRYRVNAGRSWGLWSTAAERSGVMSNPTPGEPNAPPVLPPIRITEVNYHPSSEDDRDEFIELFNAGDRPVDLTGWRLSGGVDFVFADGTVLPPQRYLLVVPDAQYAEEKYPQASVTGNWSGKLNNRTEWIRLTDGDGNQVVAFRYADDGSWPRGADGPDRGEDPNDPLDPGPKGMTLELRHPDLNPAAGGSWVAETEGGTPGAPRSNLELDAAPVLFNYVVAPPLPQPEHAVHFQVEADCPSGVAQVELFWRYEGAAWNRFSLSDDGLSGDGEAGDGVWAGFLPSLDRSGTVEFYFEAESRTGLRGRLPAGAPDLPFLLRVDSRDFPRSGRTRFRYIVMRSSDLSGGDNSLRNRSPRSNRLLPCALVLDGRLYQYGKVRYRGSSARSHWPPSYRVILTHDERGDEANILYFNAVNPHLQFAGMETFRRAGIPAPFATFMSLGMDDGFWTEYVQMERIDEYFVAHQMAHESGGNLYRGTRAGNGSDLRYHGEDQSEYRRAYDKVTNRQEADWSDIVRLCRALNSPEDSYVEEIEQIIDIDQWARYFAVHTVLSNQENSIYRQDGDDYFLYSRPSDRRFILLPWDMDSVFQEPQERLFRPDLPAVRRFLRHPLVAPRYWYHLSELIDRTFSAPAVEITLGRIRRSAGIRYLGGMRSFRAERSRFIRAQLPTELTACASAKGGGTVRTDLIPQSSMWRFFRGTEDPSAGLEWTLPDFDDSAWEEGPAGFGYGDGDDATVLADMRGAYTTVYVRRTFTLEDPTELVFYELWIDYDDGFVAYLNGVETARRSAGSPGTILPHDARADGSHEAGEPERIDMEPFVGAARAGTNVLAVMGLNRAPDSSDFSLHPALVVKGTQSSGRPAGCGTRIYISEGSQIRLRGYAPAAFTSFVTVDGEPVSYDLLTGQWSTSFLPAQPAYKVAALDFNGEPVSVLDLKAEILPADRPVEVLGGTIESDRTLSSDKGPFVLDGVSVAAGAKLTIEPGVLLFGGRASGLIVEGELQVAGTAEAPVIVRAGADSVRPFIVVRSGTAELRNVEFQGGAPVRDTQAAALVSQNSGTLVLQDCTFTGAPGFVVEFSGGSLTVQNCAFKGCCGGVDLSGGSARITSCSFEENGPLPAVRLRAEGSLVLEDCTFSDQRGDGLSASEPVQIKGSRFRRIESAAVRLVGGTGSVLERCVVFWCGTGISIEGGAEAALDHMTITGNEVGCRVISAGNGGALSVENSIIWGNAVDLVSRGRGRIDVSYCLVPVPFAVLGEENRSGDPLFEDPLAGDWTIQAESPARGAARDGSDIGALPYEGPNYLLGDLNRDGKVNIADVLFLLGYQFGGGPPPWCLALADVNADGSVNVADAIYLLGYLFGGGPPPVPPQEPCP